jgi:hypothetical protein
MVPLAECGYVFTGNDVFEFEMNVGQHALVSDG